MKGNDIMYTVGEKYYSAEVIENETHVTIEAAIYRGNTIVSWRKALGIARCHPNDTFDFATGVAVATLRAEKELYDMMYEKNLALY